MAARILVVDDDDSLRELLRMHLAAAGYEVSTAPDAIAAGYQVLKSPPDLILSDVNMPFMDGFVGPNLGKNKPVPAISPDGYFDPANQVTFSATTGAGRVPWPSNCEIFVPHQISEQQAGIIVPLALHEMRNVRVDSGKLIGAGMQPIGQIETATERASQVDQCLGRPPHVGFVFGRFELRE